MHTHYNFRVPSPLSCSFRLLLLSLSLAQSMTAAVACSLPAASYDVGDRTVGVAGWVMLTKWNIAAPLADPNPTTCTHSNTHTTTVPKSTTACRPTNNSSLATALLSQGEAAEHHPLLPQSPTDALSLSRWVNGEGTLLLGHPSHSN